MKRKRLMFSLKLLAVALNILVLSGTNFMVGVSAATLPKDDIDAINQDSVHYKAQSDEIAQAACAPRTDSLTRVSGPVYFVGDSIGTQIQGELATSLSSKGWALRSNALSSRNLSGIPPSPDGLGAVDQDDDFIRTAKAVVIELGTNSGGFTTASVGQMIDKIRTLNATATIYWLDTVVVERVDYAQVLSNINSIIYGQSTEKGYRVISWNKKVFGDSADPKNINPSLADNGYIRRSDQFVHLTTAGIAAMTALITNTIDIGGNAESCACSSASLAGSENAEKIWNFLISKGLSPAHAAGIMGNLQAESGFNPRRVQGTRTPQGDSDTIKIDGVTGYGLAQWTSIGRQRNLDKFAGDRGVSVGDLALQLSFLYYESNEGTLRGAWDQLKQQTTLRTAVLSWHATYEKSGDNAARLERRVKFGIDILARFGSNTSGEGGRVGCNL